MDSQGIIVAAGDRKGLLRDITTIIAAHDLNIEFIQQFSHGEKIQIYFELSGVKNIELLKNELQAVSSVDSIRMEKPFGKVYGKRVIVIGGGAQVAQVVLGAVSEADRHNLRGEMISVDTIPLIGEDKIADAVRAVARLHRAEVVVLAGSIMGGQITEAVKEFKKKSKIPVIGLNMVGSVAAECDLIVTDPVQAGVIAVMSIAGTARFDLERVRGRKF